LLPQLLHHGIPFAFHKPLKRFRHGLYTVLNAINARLGPPFEQTQHKRNLCHLDFKRARGTVCS
jgi:hypothetical protein